MVLMRPISVASPVPTTTPVPCPIVTSVPDHAEDDRSPSAASAATGSTDFWTGTDSPVSADSSIWRLRAVIRRRSAGTRSPDARCTRSPGTSSSAGMVMRLPSRTTVALSDSMLRMAFSACSALPSWMKPIAALITTTPTITAASTISPSRALTAAAAISTRIRILLNWAANRHSALRPAGGVRRFGPCRASRSAASSALRPLSPGVQALQRLFGRNGVPCLSGGDSCGGPRSGGFLWRGTAGHDVLVRSRLLTWIGPKAIQGDIRSQVRVALSRDIALLDSSGFV